MILHLLFVLFYSVLGSSVPTEYLLVLSIIQCGLGLYFSVREDKNFVNPYNINLFALAVTNVGNLSLLGRIESGTNYMYYFASVPDIPHAAQIWCIGNSIFLIGYLAFRKKYFFPTIGLKLNKDHTNIVFGVILLLNLISGRVGFLGPFAKTFNLVGVVGILFFARLWGAEGNKKYRNFAFILFVLQVYHALTGSYLRFEILMPLIIFFVGYFTGLGNIKYAFTYRIIPFIVGAGLFLNVFSELGKNRSDFGTIFVQAYLSADDEADDESDEVYNVEVERGGFFDRSATLAQVSSCINLVNTNGFYNGTASSPLVAALIPRFLWPDKPNIAIGQWFALEIGAAYVEEGQSRANNSINMTIPGELYLDFGYLGIVIGCFLFGAFISLLWNTTQFFESHYNLFGAIFGGYMLFLALTGISVDFQIAVTYLSVYLVFLFLKRIFILAFN